MGEELTFKQACLMSPHPGPECDKYLIKEGPLEVVRNFVNTFLWDYPLPVRLAFISFFILTFCICLYLIFKLIQIRRGHTNTIR